MPRGQKTPACIHCRQMKLKYDTQECFPASCSRCRRQRLRCSVDPTFKRVSKKERLHNIEQELRDIKATLKSSPNADVETGLDRTQSDTGELHELQLTASPTSVAQILEWTYGPQKLDDVEIQPKMISDLLQRYYEYYHPQLPILVEAPLFISTYGSCPLLFWTVIAVSSRRSPFYSHLYLKLSKPVQALATLENLSDSVSLTTIQALLILIWWPFPFRTTSQDPSWTYCALATHGALRIGLHRPYHQSDFFYQSSLSPDSLVLVQKTWIACFITNQDLSSQLGLPATVQVDNTIIKALSDSSPWLPDILKQHLKIAYQSYQFCHLLGHHELTTTGLLPNPASTIRMFDSAFNALQTCLEEQWTLPVKISFLRAKLALYSFAFMDNASASQGFNSVSGSSEVLVKAYEVAMNLVQTICGAPDEVPFWTSWIRVSLVFAVIVLITLGPSIKSSFGDPIVVRNLINQAWDLLHGNSDMELDHYSRICAAIEHISKRDPTQLSIESSNLTKSRMAANMSIDFIWCAKERFSKSVLESKPADYTSAAENEKEYQFNLDLELVPLDLDGYGSAWDFLYQDNETNMGNIR